MRGGESIRRRLARLEAEALARSEVPAGSDPLDVATQRDPECQRLGAAAVGRVAELEGEDRSLMQSVRALTEDPAAAELVAQYDARVEALARGLGVEAPMTWAESSRRVLTHQRALIGEV